MWKIIFIVRIINNFWWMFQSYFSTIFFPDFNLLSCELDNFSFNPNLGERRGVILSPVRFPLMTQKWWKLQPWQSVAFSNILLETFMIILSLQILGKTQTWVFLISRFQVNSLCTKVVINPEPIMILTWNLDQ